MIRHIIHTRPDDEDTQSRFGKRIEVRWGDGPHVEGLTIVDEADGESVVGGLDLDLEVTAAAPVGMKDDVVERFTESRDNLIAPLVRRMSVAIRVRRVPGLDELASGRHHAHREIAILEEARQFDANHLARPRLGEFYLIFSYDGGQKQKITERTAPR